MAEQTQNIKSVNELSSSGSNLMGRATNMLENFQKFSNEPTVQRSIPVMITLFVIFIGIVLFVSFREPPKTALFLLYQKVKNHVLLMYSKLMVLMFLLIEQQEKF